MNIHKIHDLSDNDVVTILKTGLKHVSEDEINNYSDNASHNPANLFYLLASGRYARGSYYIIENNGEYVASSGWNMYNADTAIVLSRSYVSIPYRTSYIMGKKLLPLMLDACKDVPKVWITCNEHNKTIYEWFTRSNSGKKGSISQNWPEIYTKFKPIGKKIIYYTEQYVAELQK